MSNNKVGSKPTRLRCPECHDEVLTSLKRKPTTKTRLIVLFLCSFICGPCVIVRYCWDSCKNANHYCPNCDTFIGTYKA